MDSCYICGKVKIQLTRHVRIEHDMSLEQYVILKDHNGNPPKCQCGLCESSSEFYRGKFKKYAKNHFLFKVREELYIKKFGQPKCNYCGVDIFKFKRGIPNKYCSLTCSGKCTGFSLPSTQKTIACNIASKYGVSSVSKLDFVKAKLRSAHTGVPRNYVVSDRTKEKISTSLKSVWKTAKHRNLTIPKIIYGVNSDKEKTRRSEYLKAKWRDPVYRKDMLETKNVYRLTKLHRKVKEALALESLGFISEQNVGKYLVDELNKEKKIAIEINGDYVHANPKKFKLDDIIALRGGKYTAAEKWESDSRKINALENYGYHVVIVWESDNWDEKLLEIKSLMGLP